MGLRLPDWLRYELAHMMGDFGTGRSDLGWRDCLNQFPRLVIAVTVITLLVLVAVFWEIRTSGGGAPVSEGSPYAWFYDLNTNNLFRAARNKLGPIEAPSGPLANGEEAGVRAHVYSYVMDPNAEELFVGFLEKPDPNTPGKRPTWRRGDFDKWTRYRVIRRVEDTSWVPAASEAGQAILQSLIHPSAEGLTAQYQLPQ